MKIEIRLRKILQSLNLDRHGITQEIARDIHVHRHAVSRIYHNDLKNPPLDVLADICDWLQRKGAPAASLPGALFGAGVTKLWGAVTAPGTVTLYLGEYQQSRGGAASSWISRRDAAVGTEFVRYLSIPENCGDERPTLVTLYVPFRADPGAQRVRRKEFADDRLRARATLAQMRAGLAGSSAILIGSQRSNFLVECLVADLFGSEPFDPAGKRLIPFHMTFPRRVLNVCSCFGGLNNPTGRGAARPGTYYLDGRGAWQCCPWIDGVEDSGVVITCYDPGTKSLQLAVMGLTGRATEALGLYLTNHSEDFWPPAADSRHGNVGIHVCRFQFAAPAPGESRDTAVRDMKVVPLDREMLNEHLKRQPREPAAAPAKGKRKGD